MSHNHESIVDSRLLIGLDSRLLKGLLGEFTDDEVLGAHMARVVRPVASDA